MASLEAVYDAHGPIFFFFNRYRPLLTATERDARWRGEFNR